MSRHGFSETLDVKKKMKERKTDRPPPIVVSIKSVGDSRPTPQSSQSGRFMSYRTDETGSLKIKSQESQWSRWCSSMVSEAMCRWFDNSCHTLSEVFLSTGSCTWAEDCRRPPGPKGHKLHRDRWLENMFENGTEQLVKKSPWGIEWMCTYQDMDTTSDLDEAINGSDPDVWKLSS